MSGCVPAQLGVLSQFCTMVSQLRAMSQLGVLVTQQGMVSQPGTVVFQLGVVSQLGGMFQLDTVASQLGVFTSCWKQTLLYPTEKQVVRSSMPVGDFAEEWTTVLDVDWPLLDQDGLLAHSCGWTFSRDLF